MEAFLNALQNGSDVNELAADGNRPIHKATIAGMKEMVLQLIDAGAELTSKDKDGCSALHIACKMGNTVVALALIERGADATAKNNDGMNPLEVACDSDVHCIIEEAVNRRKRNRATNRWEEEIKWRVENALPFEIAGMDGRAAETVNGRYDPNGETSNGWPVYVKAGGVVMIFDRDPTTEDEVVLVWLVKSQDHVVAKAVVPQWTPPCFPNNLPRETVFEVYNPGRLMGILAAKPKIKANVTITAVSDEAVSTSP